MDWSDDWKIAMEDPLTGKRVKGPETGTGELLEVLRMLAHKLSQPLTSLRGSIEVALMGESDMAEYRRVLALSLHESQRIAETLEILRDVLDIEGPLGAIQRVSWTQSVEQLLEAAALLDKNGSPRIASNLKGGVWVVASPHHLTVATRRMINSAVRSAQFKRKIRIELSATEDAACLSVFEESPHAAVASVGNSPTAFDSEAPLLAGIDKWLVHRAAERQGGWLKIRKMSDTCRCYEMNLPLPPSEVSGNIHT